MESVEELCCFYIALLRSCGLLHQNNHWIVKGKSAYGEHLLFERIYNSAQENVDLAAEKFVGLFGVECLDISMQAKLIQKSLEKYGSMEPLESSLAIESEFLAYSQHFYDKLKEDDKMSLGLDDMIMSIASVSEGHQYLLKQSSEGKVEETPAVFARISLLKKLQKLG